MSAIRSSSSALLLLGGVATLPGAATVRSRFPQRSPPSDSADAELGYMQQPLGPATAAQVVTMATTSTPPRSGDGSEAGFRPKSAREIVAVVLGRNQKYSSLLCGPGSDHRRW
ncbi:hypothetical protein LX36DRAFT_668619 [Colletotrichum falcatum]|nr:hypothetical protein LX36DRAFT_668619 [Colletotrichum falcatum]